MWAGGAGAGRVVGGSSAPGRNRLRYPEAVTRIIAGFAGSLTLEVPGAGTRPTSDRVREAIFSALDSRDLVRGRRVLDLYAGSGALGLEALSRGAAHVTLVERDARAANACRANAQRVRGASIGAAPVDVVVRTVAAFLASTLGQWDMVFLDPPYDSTDDELAADLTSLAGHLTADAVVLIERATRSPSPRWPENIRLDRTKKHGDTTLWWGVAGHAG